MMPGRPPEWTPAEKADLARRWSANQPVSVIARQMNKSPDAITSQRRRMRLPEREKILFRISTQRISYVFPTTPGVRKLLRRADTLREWLDEGRSDYELARSFHVPIRDVETVIAKLGWTRPAEVAEQELRVSRRCVCCGEMFIATQYRFRCDNCCARADRLDATEYQVAA